MAIVVDRSGPGLVVTIVVLVALAFAGGYYYYQQKDKDTLFNMNVGGKNISATVEHK